MYKVGRQIIYAIYIFVSVFILLKMHKMINLVILLIIYQCVEMQIR